MRARQSELFFAKGLDDPNQLDAARQIAVFAHVIFWPRGRAIAIARSDSARRANRSAKTLGERRDARWRGACPLSRGDARAAVPNHSPYPTSVSIFAARVEREQGARIPHDETKSEAGRRCLSELTDRGDDAPAPNDSKRVRRVGRPVLSSKLPEVEPADYAFGFNPLYELGAYHSRFHH